MTKEEHIKWWVDDAQRSWKTAVFLMDGEQFVFSLFAFHLAIEKLMKAIWIKDNISDTPTRTHSLTKLYDETDLELENGWYDYLATISDWNIEGRYPDFKNKIYKRATAGYVQEHYQKLCALRALLESTLSAS